MGAQLSALRKDIGSITPRGVNGWLDSLHTVGHYSIIPAIYLFGLWHSNELTLNPLELFEKILVS
jgi:hypothetical protein